MTTTQRLHQIPWCSQQHKSQSELSNASKDTVTMTTRDHSRHEWMEEGNKVKLQLDDKATVYIVLVALLMTETTNNPPTALQATKLPTPAFNISAHWWKTQIEGRSLDRHFNQTQATPLKTHLLALPMLSHCNKVCWLPGTVAMSIKTFWRGSIHVTPSPTPSDWAFMCFYGICLHADKPPSYRFLLCAVTRRSGCAPVRAKSTALGNKAVFFICHSCQCSQMTDFLNLKPLHLNLALTGWGGGGCVKER